MEDWIGALSGAQAVITTSHRPALGTLDVVREFCPPFFDQLSFIRHHPPPLAV